MRRVNDDMGHRLPFGNGFVPDSTQYGTEGLSVLDNETAFVDEMRKDGLKETVQNVIVRTNGNRLRDAPWRARPEDRTQSDGRTAWRTL
jgi:hypothetical protein